MGQSSSTHNFSPTKFNYSQTNPVHSDEDNSPILHPINYTYTLPDECLALIFHSLPSIDRKKCSLVCRRWLLIEGQNRHRLSLNAKSEIIPKIPSIFTRFNSVTKLALRSDRKYVSINDEGLILISIRCVNLTRLKLRGCRDVTHFGMACLAKNCKKLRKFSCGSCMFGAQGMNALLNNSISLEELSVKRLRCMNNTHSVSVEEPISIGSNASCSLKSICLKELYNGQCFGPFITGSKNLRTLKLLRCLGDWDRVFETIASNMENHLVEILLERVQVSDIGLKAISKFLELETLHLVKVPECTDVGVVDVARNCKLLRKVHIDGWRTNRIGDIGLSAIAENTVNLKELVLMGLKPTKSSLLAIASNCQKLERLALCGSESIGDAEVTCIATKCMALKKLCIKGCEVTDEGIVSFSWGCPNLVKIKVKKCKHVTSEVADVLRSRTGSLAVNLDVGEVDVEVGDGSASDGGVVEEGVEFPPIASTVVAIDNDIPSTSNVGRSSASNSARFGVLGGRGFVICSFRRWSNGRQQLNEA
ncbi:putative F-box/LRR-repeat protein 8 [Lycium ferocissimum]|uniref:putative F-box/LRR-repeat protein 8 n=1 Tax=Lycium ferocissimum TaxID=112874 RepID=UPI0028168E46|nr:putative F-box/LRR-repeat protein 8 [Lycium ferocissimum]